MKLRLLKFEAKNCAVCISMNRKRVVENLASEFPELETITLCIADKHGDSPEGSDYEAAYALSDELNVVQLPTYILQTEHGVEMARHEGDGKLTEFRKLVESATEELTISMNALPRVLAFLGKEPPA